MKRILPVFLLAMIAASPAFGQAPAKPTVIVLRPAAEPVPALKYRLEPERRSLSPGNAAIYYHRALTMLVETRPRPLANGKTRTDTGWVDERTLYDWIIGPIAQIPKDKARAELVVVANVMQEIELGAQRAICDWEFDQRKEGINLVMPEIQGIRSLARLVKLKVLVAILDGDVDQAMRWIEIGMVMGRHASDGPTLIQALVGIAIDSMMAQCLEELIQAPGTPSLYWALADHTRPFIDLRRSLEGERYLLEKELPELAELDMPPWSLDQARRFSEALQKKIFSLDSGTQAIPSFFRGLGVAGMAAKIYPSAKRGLIALGRPAATVEAMPIVQASVLYSMLEYQRLRDDSYKWMNVPYWQVSLEKTDALLGTFEDKMSNPLITLFRQLTPAFHSARLAAVRLDRMFDALQCVEAIRMDAAAHGGKLPASLAAITVVPTPLDLATGKPFEYKTDGRTATLSAPYFAGGPRHPSYAIHFELKLAP